MPDERQRNRKNKTSSLSNMDTELDNLLAPIVQLASNLIKAGNSEHEKVYQGGEAERDNGDSAPENSKQKKGKTIQTALAELKAKFENENVNKKEVEAAVQKLKGALNEHRNPIITTCLKIITMGLFSPKTNSSKTFQSQKEKLQKAIDNKLSSGTPQVDASSEDRTSLPPKGGRF